MLLLFLLSLQDHSLNMAKTLRGRETTLHQELGSTLGCGLSPLPEPLFKCPHVLSILLRAHVEGVHETFHADTVTLQIGIIIFDAVVSTVQGRGVGGGDELLMT